MCNDMNWFQYRLSKARKWLTRLQLPQKDFILLDAGSGDGVYSYAFLELFPKCRVIMLDSDWSQLLHALKNTQPFKKRVTALHADYHRIPLKNEMLDAVIFSFSLHETTKKKTVLFEANRVLKREGQIFIFDYHPSTPTWWIIPEKKISYKELLHLLKETKFNNVRLFLKTSRFYILKGRK